MSWPQQNSWTDRELLQALDMRDHDGASYGAIAKATGRSRSASIAMLSRIDKDTDASDPTGHRNGTMPRRWWE
jgi:transposase